MRLLCSVCNFISSNAAITLDEWKKREISGPLGELMRAFTCCWSRFHLLRLSDLVNHLSGCVHDEFFLSSQKPTQANGAILLEVRLFCLCSYCKALLETLGGNQQLRIGVMVVIE